MSAVESRAVGSIRLYRRSDRADVLLVGADTAFFGEPVEIYMEDRRLFCDAFLAYYTDLEAPSCWIAEVDGRVVGFLAGCPDSATKPRRYLRFVLPSLLRGVIQGRYRWGPRTRNYARRVVGALLHREAPHVDFAMYPAHFHLNVAAKFRGLGLGRRLTQAYANQLRLLRVRGVHLMTTSLNVAAWRLYEGLGFRLLDSRPTRMWRGLVDQEVENRTYGLAIRDA